jgi:hypothetical protein
VIATKAQHQATAAWLVRELDVPIERAGARASDWLDAAGYDLSGLSGAKELTPNVFCLYERLRQFTGSRDVPDSGGID